ncbi:HEAT repeat domain-containing protein [Mucilaginibacter endophyticus]|uniref:HEAT repeat domain-containing protein n=1 Tax=Mucilaginibacter endophyticus TaxID=2675003 RepID=UPI000E0D817E|nr:HEAT repeat domain-containing protein [Mucilaginibacter endophyticus]
MDNYFSKAGLNRINTIKSLGDFCRLIKENPTRDIACLKDGLQRLAGDGFLNDLIDYELTQLLEKTVYVPNPGSFTFINLFDCDYCAFNLFYSNELDFTDKPLCAGFAADRLMLSLTDGDIRYDMFRQPDPYPLDILDKSRKMELVTKDAVFANGEILSLKAHEDIIVFKESGDKSMILLVVTSKDESAFLWEYDTLTQTPKQIITGDTISSRLEHTLRLLGELGDPASLPHLWNFLDYEDYNVRWEAARAIMLIDFNKGVEALEYLKKDPHPQIQKSVAGALVQVQNLINA